MILLLTATNRPGSNSAKVAAHVLEIYRQKQLPVEVLDLQTLPPEIFAASSYAEKPAAFAPFQEAITRAAGIVVITPEYNGGFPGVFKYFIDMLKFPESFRDKPFAFIGLSAGMGGALRPIEQFETLLTYLHGLIYPERVTLSAIQNHLDESGRLKTPELVSRLEKQADGFARFLRQLGKL